MPNPGEEWTCPRCDRSFIEGFNGTRSRSGRFVEDLPDGGTEEFKLLCEDCHREVVRS